MSQSAGVVNTQTSDERCLKPYDNTTCQQVAFKADVLFFFNCFRTLVWNTCLMPVHDGSLRSLQGLRSSLYNPLISRGFSPPHLLLFQEQESLRGEALTWPTATETGWTAARRAPERLSHAASPHRWRCFDGRSVVAKHKDGCCEIAFLLSAQDGCNACCARACVYMCVYSNHLQEQN